MSFRTVGHERATTELRRMLAGGTVPHALLIAGPPRVGKTTLAIDLAAGLLCVADGLRPCGSCRGCRLTRSGNHPDLHLLAPTGAGRTIPIGEPGAGDQHSVRGLIGALALRPIEGAARVAIICEAERLGDDAANALLKTLEEPPAGTTIVLCVDEERHLLPTIRSRAVTLRLGPVASTTIGELLVERGVATGPDATRIARIADGAPGLALALATSPEALGLRERIGRGLLDLAAERPSVRLRRIGELASAASRYAMLLDGEPVAGDGGATSAAARRQGAIALVGIWISLVRDLAAVSTGASATVRDLALRSELDVLAGRLEAAALASFASRLAETGALVARNANPDLALDVAVLTSPSVTG